MAVTIEELNKAITESKRFIKIAEIAKKRILKEGKFISISGCKETGAVKKS